MCGMSGHHCRKEYMSEVIANCPRCSASNMTFDFKNHIHVDTLSGWKEIIEAFCICRNCKRSSTFVLSLKSPGHKGLASNDLTLMPMALNNYFKVDDYLSLKDREAKTPPDHLPGPLLNPFNEGAKCLAVSCFNAAGTMFRLCIDLATEPLLPKEETAGLNSKTRRDLGLRLPWLFDNRILPENLRDLSHCVKEDGNDGAHRGILSQLDAEDMFDFTFEILENIYTTPEKVKIATERRASRRSQK